MNASTHVIQVTNVSPSTTLEQMRTLLGFLGNIEELKLFPPDDSPMPVTSRVCFVKFLESESVGVSQHLTNTVFVDRALIVVPFAEGVIPDESKAMSLLAPANAVAGVMPGGGLLPTPNPLTSVGGTPFGGVGAPNLEQMAAMGIGPNMNPQALSADFLKLIQSMDPKLNPLAAGLNLNPGLKNDGSNKEIEEAMKRVREAQSLISAAIEPGSKKDDKRKHSRSRSRSRRKRSRSRSRHRRSQSKSRRRSRSRNRRRSKSPRRRRSHSRDRSRRSRSRDRKEEKSKKRSKTPPKSYSSARRSRSVNRRHRRSRSVSRSPKKHLTRSPSLRRHKKEKKKDKDREKERDRERREHRDQSREQRERLSSKKSKDKERDRKSDSDKGDVKVTRDYDEEEQGYGSEKEVEEEDDEERKSDSDSASSAKGLDEMERCQGPAPKKSKVNGDDHHQEDMDMSD
ncbi:serine/arginine-rich splicing factor 11-like isoform X1 [Phycodurus eques]|uniref:serine/arginine-rich splicing factor 11-like isoform X1 n=2 Tax=Phycodurus eques TaxID=693459 RepID=UPI002ACDEDAE|nr:serine/arginine-rich splicing factor 11-like isoform X1 [Phycodurus eques]